MTLEQILRKYQYLKYNITGPQQWAKMDQFVEELAQLASGTPLVFDVDSPQLFREVPQDLSCLSSSASHAQWHSSS
jgi:glucose-6-phosphate 1-dehydrogenase